MATETILDLYCFSEWPFLLQPTDESSAIWADRKELDQQIRRLVRDMSELAPSGVHPVWGWWGAGKTHTLRYIAHYGTSLQNPFLSIYVELPSGCSTFRDFYHAVWLNLEPKLDLMRKAYTEAFTKTCGANQKTFTKQVCPRLPEFMYALTYLCSGDHVRENAARLWLSAQKLDRAQKGELGAFGFTTFLDSDEQVVAVFQSMTNLISASRVFSRFVLLVDEFQRLAKLTRTQRSNFQVALDQLFNVCPKHFSLFLAYSDRTQDRIEKLVSGGLLSRMGVRERLAVGLLEEHEAKEFVKELFAAYRPADRSPPSPFFPFDEEVIDYVIGSMETKGWHLKPRSLMEVLNRIAADGREQVREAPGKLTKAFAEGEILAIEADAGIVSMLQRED